MNLGIDIGGSKVVLVLARGEGEIVAELRLDQWTCGDPRGDLARLLAEARELVARHGGRIAGGGVSAPGPLDVAAGCVLATPNLRGWQRVPIVAEFEREFACPFALENDANCGALAEWRFGVGQGRRHLLFLTMSTGVGAGFVLDGALYRGSSGQGREVGHMPVVAGGRRCQCGLRGCLEAYCGGAALALRIAEDIAAGAHTSILELAQGDPQRISAQTWTAAMRAGDRYALALAEEFVERLAQGLASLIAALDPECIVLGTIVASNADLFLEPVRERVRALTWPEFHGTRVEPSKLGERLPYWAAVAAALRSGSEARRDR